MSSNENSIILEYIDFYKKYKEIYGKNIVILLEVGSFYEIYSHINEPSDEYFDIYEIANILNLTVSRKNNKGDKRYEKISLNNYYMCGFPNYIVNKYINMLINSNYIAVIINQRDSENPIDKKKEHYLYEIVSPSTYYSDDILVGNGYGNINDNSNCNSNELMTIYIQELIDRKTGNITIPCHISLCDIYTGNIRLFEIIGYDLEMTFEELNRLFYYKPKEVVIFGDISKVNISKYLQIINSQNFLFINRINNYNKEFLKLSYQNEIIKKVYSIKKIGLLNPIDYIELGNRPDFVTCVCYLFSFLYEHNPKLINNLNIPTIIEDFTNINEKHMVLVNNAIKDLNIISNNPNELCINKLLNKCNTSIGKRYFNFMLKNPLISTEKLEIYYHLTELFQKENIIINNNNYLKKIIDIEKLVRKMKLYKLNPYELLYIKKSLKNLYDMIKYIHMEYKDFELIYKLLNISIEDLNIFNQLIKFFEFFNATFNENILSKYSINNITENIFNNNYNSNISELQYKINKIESYYVNLCNDLNKFMNNELLSCKKTKTKTNTNSKDNEQKIEQFFKIEVNNKLDNLNRVEIRNQKEFDKYNDIEYYYIYITKTRFEKFKSLFKNSDSDIKKHIIDTYNFIDFKSEPTTNSANSTNVKLCFEQINKFGILINQYKHQIHNMLFEEYNKIIDEIIDEYSCLFNISIKFIEVIDYITNNANNANKFNYIKPVINCERRNTEDPSYLKIKGLRHPIIEQINNNNEYIPNDIEIGTKNSYCSYLLYGVNTIGKSSLLKSIGISVIMASAGMYTPCSYFEFKPFHHIFTHINKNDDIWKNLSLFSSDMLSIKTFLNMMNNKSLILSDELMNSSETESSISILGATINKLVSMNVCHIFTTHFHELRKLSLIRQLHNDGKIRLCYLHVQHNDCDGNFIFDRKLRDIDNEHLDLYGLEIAKGLNLPADFLLDANKIRCEVLGINNEIVSTKKSKYNSTIYIDNCGICGSFDNLEVHHLLFQKDANNNGFIDDKVVESGNNGIHKNKAYNLIPICQNCHDDIHNGKKKITGFIQSINGRILK
jgi:DNA mismatch repair protein MutS